MKERKGMRPVVFNVPKKTSKKNAPALLGLSRAEVISKIEEDVAAFLIHSSIQVLDVAASVEASLAELKEKLKKRTTRKESNEQAFSRPTQEYIPTERQYASKDKE